MSDDSFQRVFEMIRPRHMIAARPDEAPTLESLASDFHVAIVRSEFVPRGKVLVVDRDSFDVAAVSLSPKEQQP